MQSMRATPPHTCRAAAAATRPFARRRAAPTAHAQLIAHAHARMMCAHAPDADVIVAGILKISVPPLALYSCVFVYNSFSSLVRVGDGALIIQDHVCCPFSKWHFFKILFFLVYTIHFFTSELVINLVQPISSVYFPSKRHTSKHLLLYLEFDSNTW